jgi:hypothetical protein
MSKNLNSTIKAHHHARCTDPDMRELLPDYIVELLADSAACEVEDHLLFCRRCREDYLSILSVRSTAQQAKSAHSHEEKLGAGDAEIMSKANFKD